MNTKKIIQSVAAIAILALVLVKIPVQPVLAQEFGDTTTANFNAFTSNTCYIGEANMGDGEVLLVPTIGEEFTAGVPAGWSTTPWTLGGEATVSGGKLSVDGALFATNGVYTPGRSLEYVGTFGAELNQHAGFGVDYDTQPVWAMFSLQTATDALNARTNDGSFSSNSPSLGAGLIGVSHHYRIEWNATNVIYYIDGTWKHQVDSVNFVTNLRPAISDIALGTPIQIDWIRMSPYSSSCIFQSRSFNAGATTTWADLDWTGSVPLNTTATFYTRVSDNNSTWSPWALVDGTGNLTGDVDGQYIQYRIELANTNNNVTPIIRAVTLTSADKVWNGSTSSAWETGANWTPSGVPTTADDVLIPASGPSNWPQISVNTAQSDGLIVQNGAKLGIMSAGEINAVGKVKNHGVLTQTIASLPANVTTNFLYIGGTKPYYGVAMSPAAEMSNVTVSIAGNKECTTVSGDSVRRCFDIQAPDGISTIVTFHYLPNELNGLNPANMLAYHWADPGWELAGVFQSRVASGSNLSVTMSGVNNFSPFVLSPGTPTAVNLESFTEASTNAPNNMWNSVILFVFLSVILIGMTMIIMRKRNLQH